MERREFVKLLSVVGMAPLMRWIVPEPTETETKEREQIYSPGNDCLAYGDNNAISGQCVGNFTVSG